MRRSVLCAAVLLTLLAIAPIPAVAQDTGPDQEYLALLTRYRSGDFTQPVVSLTGWPERRVREALRRVTRDRYETAAATISALKASIMLETEVALALANSDQPLSDFHLDMGRSLVRTLETLDAGANTGPDAIRFRERWRVLAIGIGLVRRSISRSQQELNLGLTDFPRSSELTMMIGVLAELQATTVRHASVDVVSQTFNLRGNWPSGQIDKDLAAAAAAYQRALDLRGDNWPAHLRLGWVALANRSLTRSREQLDIVLKNSTQSDLLYLSHLFLGALEDAERHREAALTHYRAAHEADPGAQSGRLALIRALREMGQPDEARRIEAEYQASASGAHEDPWWYFALGFTGLEVLEWLRAEAWRP